MRGNDGIQRRKSRLHDADVESDLADFDPLSDALFSRPSWRNYEAVEVVQVPSGWRLKRKSRQAGRKGKLPGRDRDIARIVFLSALVNSALLLFGHITLQLSGVAQLIEQSFVHSGTSGDLQDLVSQANTSMHAKLSVIQASAAGKGSLALTVVPFSAATSMETKTLEEAADAEVPEVLTSQDEIRDGYVPPILKKNRPAGSFEVGSFKSLSLTGTRDECFNMGYSMLSDADAPNEALEVVTDSEEISIAKICAPNGSVLIVCRNEQITISPRRPRPDDRCSRELQAPVRSLLPMPAQNARSEATVAISRAEP